MGRPLHAEERARRLGAFLRRVREERKFSLDAVAEMSAGYAERLTKSHLSRIENGQAEPSFRKLFVLSRIYGVPLVSLAERFEVDLERELKRVDLGDKTDRRIYRDLGRLSRSGRYAEALPLAIAAIDRLGGRAPTPSNRRWSNKFRLVAINCLLRLGHLECARAEAEEFLEDEDRDRAEALLALQLLISAHYKMRRYSLASMLLQHAQPRLQSARIPARMRADFEVLHGNVLQVTGNALQAVSRYRDALRIYARLSNDLEVCRTRINLGAAQLELGEHKSAREALESAFELSEERGYTRLGALAGSHLAVLHYRLGDFQEAERWALRSNSMARAIRYTTVVFRNCFYLREIARQRGDRTSVFAHEKTLRTLSSRVESYLPELEAFRAATGGGR